MSIERVKPGEKITAKSYNELVDAANANTNFFSDGVDFVHSKNGTVLKSKNNINENRLKVPRPYDCRLIRDSEDPDKHYFQTFDPFDHAKLYGYRPDHWWIWNGTSGQPYSDGDFNDVTKWATLKGNFPNNWEGVQLVPLTCYDDEAKAELDQKSYGYMFADTAYQSIPKHPQIDNVISAGTVHNQMIMVSYKLHTINESTGQSNSFRIINCQGGEINYGLDSALSDDNKAIIPDSYSLGLGLSSIGLAISAEHEKVLDLYEFGNSNHVLKDLNDEFEDHISPPGDILYRQNDLETQPGLSAKVLNYIPLCALYLDSDTEYSKNNLRIDTPQNSIEHKVRTPLGKRPRKVDQIYKFDDKTYVYNEVSSLKHDAPTQQDILIRGLSGDADVLRYLSLSSVESTPDSLVEETSCYSIDKDGKDHSLELYKFKESNEKSYEQIPASDLTDGKTDLVIRHKDTEDAKVEYLKLTDVAHFGDNELNGMNGKGYAPTDISSTETYTLNSGEKIIRIHGFASKNAKDAYDTLDENDDILLRHTNLGNKDVQYVKLSSVYAPTDTKRSEKETNFSQRSIEDKIVDGKNTRQLKSFDDINNDTETVDSLSTASSATLLVRKVDDNGKNLKYIDINDVLDNPDSTMNVGLSSLERNKSNLNNKNYFNFFQFGIKKADDEKVNLSSPSISSDIIVRSKVDDTEYKVSYKQISVEYPVGDYCYGVESESFAYGGAIEGPKIQTRNAQTGEFQQEPKGSYNLANWNTNDADVSSTFVLPHADVLVRENWENTTPRLRYLSLSALSAADYTPDSEVGALQTGIRKSIQRIDYDYGPGSEKGVVHNVLQIYGWDDPEIVSPVDLASSSPTIPVRAEDGTFIGETVKVKYVPLSSLSAIPNDTDISQLNQKSIETKYNTLGTKESYQQLRRFENGSGDYTPSQISANASSLDVLIRDRTSGRELKYASVENFQKSQIPTKEIEVITDIDFSFVDGKVRAELHKKKVKVVDEEALDTVSKQVMRFARKDVQVDSTYSETTHLFEKTMQNIWTVPNGATATSTVFEATPHSQEM